ncbi:MULTISPECIES: helix-turn-helix domain-containing protein [unclassified Microbacterium]|uniref:helix-turn-helix domain-containing protein n=1 Tax=unclassified Microbacterium TaxID=2609290 RepID=UPI003868E0C2
MKIPDELINKATSDVLRGVMKESGMSQQDWSDRTGVSPTVVQKLLSGKQAVKVPQLLALVSATRLTPEEVMERISRAVDREMSDAPVSLDAHRAKKPAEMTHDELDELRGAAGRDAELEEDEPLDT